MRSRRSACRRRITSFPRPATEADCPGQPCRRVEDRRQEADDDGDDDDAIASSHRRRQLSQVHAACRNPTFSVYERSRKFKLTGAAICVVRN